MALKFIKMVTQKSYQHVVEQIQTAIIDGELKQGDCLPSEMKLKDAFDTSRGTIREALRVLEQKGLISIRTGVKGGAVIKAVNTEAMSDSMALLIRHGNVSLPHLAEFRKLLEGHVAQQAARLANLEDIRGLKDILAKIQILINTDPPGWEDFHRLDANFHQELARIGQNPLLQANLTTIHENIHTYFHQYLPFSRELLDEDYQDLCKIMAAVERQDEGEARIIAQHHVARFSELMAEHQYAQKIPDKRLPGNKEA